VPAGAYELFPLYHPAAAMYNQTLRATLFEDARALGDRLRE
jgi:uracil-DNA glycosylase